MSSVLELTPLTRVEGHGKVLVRMDGNRVESLQLSLCESPRLFEALLVGKRFAELPEIICRICSICSSVHRVTSLLALERAFGVEVSAETELYRQLIVYGGQIESHALHLFCLVLPDHYRVQGFADLAREAPRELQLGLRVKAAGNLIQETVGGRLIHPVNLIPGGMGKPLEIRQLKSLRETLQTILPEALDACGLFTAVSTHAPLPAPHFLTVTPGTASPLFGDSLTTGNSRTFAVEHYREQLAETVASHSNAKFVTIDGRLPTVGALARLSLGEQLSPQAAALYSANRETFSNADIRANNLAQSIELVDAVERSLVIVDTLLEGSTPEQQRDITPRQGTGTAVMEAPRGVLIHHYDFDGRGICSAADIITPTALNQAAMERDLLARARQLEGADDDELKLQLEILVRTYDPCISCAVHIVRRGPGLLALG